MENIIEYFAASVFVTYGLIFAIFTASAILDHRSWHKCSVLTFVFGLYVLSLVTGDFGIEVFVVLAILYLPAGFGWSYCKWRMRIASSELKLKRHLDTHAVPDDGFVVELKDSINHRENIDVIMCWIFSWPTSVIGSLLGGIYDYVEILFRDKFIGIFSKLSTDGQYKLDSICREHSSKDERS